MILIVDDHADSCEMLRRMLARHGYASESVGSAEAALTAAHAQRPDVIVMDEMMPDMTGLEAVRRMRQDPALKDVNVLFYSAAYDLRKLAEAQELGAKGWLVKGVNRLSDVVDKVADCLNQA